MSAVELQSHRVRTLRKESWQFSCDLHDRYTKRCLTRALCNTLHRPQSSNRVACLDPGFSCFHCNSKSCWLDYGGMEQTSSINPAAMQRTGASLPLWAWEKSAGVESRRVASSFTSERIEIIAGLTTWSHTVLVCARWRARAVPCCDNCKIMPYDSQLNSDTVEVPFNAILPPSSRITTSIDSG